GPQITFPIDYVYWIRSVTASGSNSWFFEHDGYHSKKSNPHPIATLSGSGDLFYSALSSFHAGGKPASSTWGMALGNAQNTGRAESLNRTYTLEVVGSGSVTRNPRQVTLPMNSEVTFTAVPSEGGKFLHWSGDISGTENPITVTLDSNKQIVAVFEAGFQLNVTAGEDGKLNLSSTSAASGIQVQVSTDLETWTTVGPLEANSQITPGTEGRKFYRLITE
ncbi:MAG: InlB B-repeat-containing protein, partial [Verrucomicrobiota bacterium]